MRRLLAVLALAAFAGCGMFRYAEFPNAPPTDDAGETKALRYLRFPGEGARGVSRAPTVRWDRAALAADLGAPTLVVLQVSTADGQLVYRARGGVGEGEGKPSWLLASEAVRIFSRPEGAIVDSDADQAARGRLEPGRSYRLSLLAQNAAGKRIYESVRFDTEDAPAPIDAPAEAPPAAK